MHPLKFHIQPRTAVEAEWGCVFCGWGLDFFGEELISHVPQPGAIPLTLTEVSHLLKSTESSWTVFPPR